MPEAFGDVLYTPGNVQTAEVKPSDILAAMGHGILLKGVTIKGGQGLVPAGTVLGRETATKKYAVYADAGAGGLDVARGILYESVNTGTATPAGDMLCNIVYGGTLKLSKLAANLTAAAVTDFGGRSDSNRDWFIF